MDVAVLHTEVMCMVNLRKKGKCLGSIVYMNKIAASVVLEPFINGNKICHTTDVP